MMFETVGSVFNEVSGALFSGFLGVDKKYNVLWGPEYGVWSTQEPDERELEGFIARMIMLRAFD